MWYLGCLFSLFDRTFIAEHVLSVGAYLQQVGPNGTLEVLPDGLSCPLLSGIPSVYHLYSLCKHVSLFVVKPRLPKRPLSVFDI